MPKTAKGELIYTQPVWHSSSALHHISHISHSSEFSCTEIWATFYISGLLSSKSFLACTVFNLVELNKYLKYTENKRVARGQRKKN